ncbi:hypothetical protein COCC4DRAFT_25213 [Bipolaris maydis ATCC 48331]|uniref:F-box domain-containing protein n=2 Tax=Cochliobolus heterostrophus TaxID=5016 RepID=M2UF96_COCH5|nr:uncharacterized protein COCC4DRAFT_25213 [Bipolaris maydis ATCC 48331]EMD86582.1 hypothetical protein COCHEDRAFT_1218166 [Bipolaris maydis C5]KAJ6192335.1 hypothetical protein J3E72DRAFT_380104 [Bipolaris maydis]ENI02996.1 hypothetical protein COCC4DRAFT_25213 [Bipolaris maydis ATCC 48331]KAJ6203816.1 hypothetical protein PSV09DRAFT_1218166 [Bipolaris maydis]KAJ6267492.1 hypothetical protein PSV08DRAFT_373618 [Bipolaris maydis]
MPQLEDLPNELKLQVISYLPQQDLASFMRTNRTFQCLVQPILYHKIEISHQNLPQLHGLCGQLGRFDETKRNKIGDHVCLIEIDTDRLDLGTPFQIPDCDRKKTEQWIDNLLMPYGAANSVTPAIPYDPEAREKWRGAFFVLNSLDALLAYIAAKSANLESLKLDLSGYFQTPSVAELLYYKIRADLQCKRAPFPKLRHLQIDSVLDIDIPVFALSELRQLQIRFLDDDSPLEIPVFESNNLSHLHVLDLYYIKDTSSKARTLLSDYQFPHLTKL